MTEEEIRTIVRDEMAKASRVGNEGRLALRFVLLAAVIAVVGLLAAGVAVFLRQIIVRQ